MTDEEFTERLLNPHADTNGVAGSDEQDLREMREALGSYRRETLYWAEKRSAGQPSLAEKARAERWKALPQWALAMIALVTIVGGVVHLTTGHADEDAAAVTAQQPAMSTPASAAEIAADNRLLSSIDEELSYHGASSVDALRLQDARAEGHATSSGVLN